MHTRIELQSLLPQIRQVTEYLYFSQTFVVPFFLRFFFAAAGLFMGALPAGIAPAALAPAAALAPTAADALAPAAAVLAANFPSFRLALGGALPPT